MNKTDLVNAIAAQGLSKADSKKALDAVLDAISGALKEGDKVAILGFGTFSINERPAREGINPATKEKITIAAKRWLSSRLVPNLLLVSTNQNFLPACSGKKLSLPSDASHGNRFGVVAFFFLPPPHPCHAAKRHFRAQSWQSVKALPLHYHKKQANYFAFT